VRYSVPPVYRRAEDEGWARLSVALAKSMAEADIITVDDNDEDDDNNGTAAPDLTGAPLTIMVGIIRA
jgi:hypothetical protein